MHLPRCPSPPHARTHACVRYAGNIEWRGVREGTFRRKQWVPDWGNAGIVFESYARRFRVIAVLVHVRFWIVCGSVHRIIPLIRSLDISSLRIDRVRFDRKFLSAWLRAHRKSLAEYSTNSTFITLLIITRYFMYVVPQKKNHLQNNDVIIGSTRFPNEGANA